MKLKWLCVFSAVLSTLCFISPVGAKPMPASPEAINAYLAKINEALTTKLTIKEQKNLTAASYKKIFSDTLAGLGYDLNETIIEITRKYLEEDYTQMEMMAVSGFIATVFFDSQEVAAMCRDGNVITAETYKFWEKGFFKRHPEKEPARQSKTPLGIGNRPNVKIEWAKKLSNDKKDAILTFLEKFFTDLDFQKKHIYTGVQLEPTIIDFEKEVTIKIGSFIYGGYGINVNGKGYHFGQVKDDFFLGLFQ